MDTPPISNDMLPSQRVLRRFRVVFNAVRTHFRQIEKDAGLGGAQVWALNVIQNEPGIGLGEVAKRMDIHQSTASNLIKTLQQKSLLEAKKEGADKRNVQLHVTPSGQALLAQTTGPFEGVLPIALGRLDETTLIRLDQDLEKLITLLQADESAGDIPLATM